MDQAGKYRTKAERLENSRGKSRGRPIELFMAMPARAAAEINQNSLVYVKVAGDSEGMRDEADCKAVMHEKDIRGTVVAMRQVGLPLCRQPVTVMKFVEPKDDIDDPEVL